MKLTNNESEIILHRLESADCIAEALTDHSEGDEPASAFSEAQIIARAEQIERDGLHTIDLANQLDLDIIKDCCEGSTFFCDLDDAVACGEITKPKAKAYYRAATTLSKKVRVEVTT